MNSGIAARMMAAAMALVLVAVSVSAFVPSARAGWTYEWTTETPMGALASQAVVVSSPDGTVYVMGGVFDATYVRGADAYSYDSGTGDWTVLAPMTVAERGAAGTMGLDGKVYVFGGDDDSGYTQIYDPGTDAWSLGTVMPYPVWEGKAATVSDGTMWVVGGEGSIDNLDVVQIYDPVSDSWTYGPSVPTSVVSGSLVADGDDLYYSGGGVYDYTGTTNFYKYDAALGEWTTLADLPEARAAHASVVGVDGLIYLVGGASEGFNWPGSEYYSSVFVYDPAADSWDVAPDMSYARTYLGAVVTPDGRILALGGNTDVDIVSYVESLQLYTFEYSIELSASSVRAGETVLLNLDAQFQYIDEYAAEVSWYLTSEADGTIYAVDYFWVPMPDTLAVTIAVPVLAPAGSYLVVVNYWYMYADGATEYVSGVELALEVLPAPDPVDEQIAALEAQIADLQAQLVDLQGTVYDLNSSLDAVETDLMNEITALQDQVATLEDALASLEASTSEDSQAAMDEIAAMQDQIDSLQTSLTNLQTSIDEANQGVTDVQGSVDDKMSLVMGYAILGLLVVVIVLLAMMMVMGRKEAPPPPSS
jgi:N-acetylneuraminic acid mutarotase/prefoldin subunit 5